MGDVPAPKDSYYGLLYQISLYEWFWVMCLHLGPLSTDQYIKFTYISG